MNKAARKRPQGPKKEMPERRDGGELEFLSRSAMAFLDFPQAGDPFALIADLLNDRLKTDAILAVGDYDENANVFRPRAIRGLENMLEPTKKILGRDPTELAGDFGPAAKKALASGKFLKVEGGLRDFTNNLLPGPVARGIEKLLGLSGFYVVGFVKAGKIMGALSVVTRKQTALPEAALLEAFAGQAAVALERKRAQESLRESELRFRELSSLTNEGIMIHEAGIIRDANLAFARLLGYSNPDDLTGKNGLEIIPFTPESRQCLLAHMRSGSSEIYEIELVKPDGSRLPAETLGKDITYRGRPMRLVSMRDMTERKRMEEALHKSEEKFSKAFRNSPIPLAITRLSDGKFLEINRAMEEIIGYHGDEWAGRSTIDLGIWVNEDDRKRVVRSIAADEPVRDQEFSFRSQDGHIVVAQYSGEKIEVEGERCLMSVITDITERKRAEEALRTSEERFKNLFEKSTDAQLLMNLESKVVDCNTAFLRLFAIPDRAEVLGHSPEEFAPEFQPGGISTHDRGVEVMRTVMEQGSGRFEWEHRKHDDARTPLHVELIGTLISIAGQPMLHVSIRDITDRKRAEEKLAKSERRFRQLSEMLPQIVFETDAAGNITFANQSGIKSFGYTPEDLRSGITILSLIVPQDRETIQRRFVQALHGAETAAREYRAVRKDGSPFPIILHADAILEEGVPIGIRGIGIDISERKRAEEALRRSEEYFRSLIEKGSEIISVMDKNAIVHYISPSVERVLGYRPEELIGTSGFALVHPDDLSLLSAREDFIAVLGTPGSVSPTVELRDRHKDGTWRSLEVVARSIVDANGGLVIVTNAHDVTERKRAEESLRLSAVQLRRTLREAINSLSAAIEMRDPYTAGHQERVTMLAVAIAREMRLSEESIEALQIAGIVHDIGKLTVPAEILSKPTGLSEIEFSMIKAHSKTGYEILNKIDFPWPIAQIVYQHHERLDGSGYPRGLSGPDLLTEAKIISVADTVEAMSSHRPYRPALGVEAALQEISKQRGILYDPDVVEACLKLFAGHKFYF